MRSPAPLWPAVVATFLTGLSFAGLKFVLIGEIALDFPKDNPPVMPFEWMNQILQVSLKTNTLDEAITQGIAATLTLGVLLGYLINAPLAGAWRSRQLFFMSSLGVLLGTVATLWINPWFISVMVGIVYGTACAARGKVVPLYAHESHRSNTLVNGIMNATLVIGLLAGVIFGSELYDRIGKDVPNHRELRRSVLAGVLSLAALASLFIRPAEKESIPFAVGFSNLLTTSRSMIHRFWALLVSGGLAWGIASAASLAAMIFAHEELGMQFSAASHLVLFPAIGAIIGNLISHWFDRRRYVIGAYVCMAIVVGSLPLVLYLPEASRVPTVSVLMVLVGILFAAPTNVLDSKILAHCASEGDPGRGSTSMSLWHNVFILTIGTGLAVPLFLGWMSAGGQFYFLATCTLLTAIISGFAPVAVGGGTETDIDPVSDRRK